MGYDNVGNYLRAGSYITIDPNTEEVVVAKVTEAKWGMIYYIPKNTTNELRYRYGQTVVRITKKEYDNFKVKTFKERLKNVKFWD